MSIVLIEESVGRIEVVELAGPQGPPGEQGIPGEQGPPGVSLPDAISITHDGNQGRIDSINQLTLNSALAVSDHDSLDYPAGLVMIQDTHPEKTSLIIIKQDGSESDCISCDTGGNLGNFRVDGQGAAYSIKFHGNVNAQTIGNESTAVSAGVRSLHLQAAHAPSGNNDGGSLVLRPGSRTGTGVDGTVVVRQPSGTAGIHEARLYHEGSAFRLDCKSGNLILRIPDANRSIEFQREGTGNTVGMRITFGTGGQNNTISVPYGGVFGGDVAGNPGAGLLITHGGGNLRILNGQNLYWGHTNDTSNRHVGMTASSSFNGVIRLAGSSNTNAGGISTPPRTAHITSNQNNYDPGVGIFQRWSSDTSRNITGMVAGDMGEMRYIWNVGSNDIVLKHDDTNSTAANRFLTSTGADATLTPNRCAFAIYDNTSQRWRVTLI